MLTYDCLFIINISNNLVEVVHHINIPFMVIKFVDFNQVLLLNLIILMRCYILIIPIHINMYIRAILLDSLL